MSLRGPARIKSITENDMKNSKKTIINATIAAAALLCTLCIRCAADPIPTKRPNLDILTVAHRGSTRYAPENTIPAMEKAIEFGFDYVEMDIRFTKDGVPVIMHDDTVDRTTNGKGKVADYTLEELKKLVVYGPPEMREKFKDVRVPTFEEALQTIQGRALLYYDPKESPRPIIFELLKKYGFYPDKMILAGDINRELEFLKYAPEMPVMPPLEDINDMQKVLDVIPHPKAFNTNPYVLSRELVDRAHEKGILINMNTLGFGDVPQTIKQVIAAGVDSVQTDNPLGLKKVLEEMKAKEDKKNK